MGDSLSRCAFSAVEVARVLMQERWQDCSSDEDVGDATGVCGAVTLSVSLEALWIGWWSEA